MTNIDAAMYMGRLVDMPAEQSQVNNIPISNYAFDPLDIPLVSTSDHATALPVVGGTNAVQNHGGNVFNFAFAYQQGPTNSITSPIQCWQHGCNGRTFSSYGNYRRHIRERNTASKRYLCPTCGRAFSRSSARNGHFQEGKCRVWGLDEYGLLVTAPIRDVAMSTQLPPQAQGTAAAAQPTITTRTQPRQQYPQPMLQGHMSGPAQATMQLTPADEAEIDELLGYMARDPQMYNQLGFL